MAVEVAVRPRAVERGGGDIVAMQMDAQASAASTCGVGV